MEYHTKSTLIHCKSTLTAITALLLMYKNFRGTRREEDFLFFCVLVFTLVVARVQRNYIEFQLVRTFHVTPRVVSDSAMSAFPRASTPPHRVSADSGIS